MERDEQPKLAEICRRRAALASTPDVHRVLMELAADYEPADETASVPKTGETAPEEFE